MDAGPIQPSMRSAIPGGEERSVDRYNNVCLHSAIGYIAPKDMLTGRQADIHAEPMKHIASKWPITL
jgi:hypothetical protein